MEQLNRIEIRGNVGNVRIQNVGGRNVARMTVATNLAYKAQDGCAVIETTWHNVTAFEGKEIHGLEKIEKAVACMLPEESGISDIQVLMESRDTARKYSQILCQSLKATKPFSARCDDRSEPFVG